MAVRDGIFLSKTPCPLNDKGPCGGSSPEQTSHDLGPEARNGRIRHLTCCPHSCSISLLHPKNNGSILKTNLLETSIGGGV